MFECKKKREKHQKDHFKCVSGVKKSVSQKNSFVYLKVFEFKYDRKAMSMVMLVAMPSIGRVPQDDVSLNPNMSVIIINEYTTVAVVMAYQHFPLKTFVHCVLHVLGMARTSKCTDKCQIHSIRTM